MSQSLIERSYAALLAGAQRVSPVPYDRKGYAPRWQDNLMNGLPLREIERDFKMGAGRELDAKLCAAHSSAALVVNTFGPWRTAPASLTFDGMRGFKSVQFEASCPTGLGGTPPNLDLLAEGDLPVAVESKCTEWMKATPAVFSPSYDKLRGSHGDSPWFEQMSQLRNSGDRYEFLDAAQLMKHALGLLNCYKTHEVRLVYLYWEPRNAHVWPECLVHRAEADDLAARVQRSPVRLVPMSYRELWAAWEGQRSPDHLPYLITRYDLAV
jgi:hypothetical protein